MVGTKTKALDRQDTIIGVLYFYGRKSDKINGDLARLHRAFYDLISKPRYKEIYARLGLLFEDRVFGKYCETIDTIFGNLLMADLLDRLEMADQYVILPKLNSYWQNHGRVWFDNSEIELLKKIGEELFQSLQNDKK